MITHHSYVIYSVDETESLVSQFASTHDFSDISTICTESFGIDDSRDLIKAAYRQPKALSAKKLLIVKANNITLEAQQALLKILEEPPITTVFLFLLPNKNSIIPTLKSRFLEFYKEQAHVETVENDSFEEFCALDYKSRLALIVEKLDNDDNLWLKEMKYGLAKMLSSSIKSLKPNQRKSLAMVVSALNSRGASNKMLLEEVAFIMPYPL